MSVVVTPEQLPLAKAWILLTDVLDLTSSIVFNNTTYHDWRGPEHLEDLALELFVSEWDGQTPDHSFDTEELLNGKWEPEGLRLPSGLLEFYSKGNRVTL